MMKLVAAAVTGSLVAGAAFAQATEVKIGYALAEHSHYGAGSKAWIEATKAATGDRFNFVEFPSSALGGEREVLEGLQLGTVEATIVSSGVLSNFVPEIGVFDVPFLFRDFDHARAVLDGPIGTEMLTRFADHGLVAVAWGEQGFRHITNNRGPIAAPADLAGLKLRTMENPVHIKAFQTLGAAPTPMAWPEVVSALEQGTIDGQENPLSVIVSSKLNEVQKHLTLSGHVYAPNVLFVSSIFWDGLSDEDKEAFRKGAVEGGLAMRAFVDNAEATGAQAMKDAGMDVAELTAEQKEAIKAALAPAYEDYAKTFGADLLQQIADVK
ncbi:TRAP transporter substrate-binding protein [Falsigemmobacter intermedius]|uniref:DctP family TRAP transporter solute-binding subunit n=1 Tax=Falsigemmobacter intermedius TaxID=1553448 RepID=A0A3S3U8I4_9RHOB|nr:TRAP transporter substrate-binding protein [Falsigemmobacter intermedius]RWY36643.1 DctP family TRAP transporter solute-binding subunit [Falsigemmobacter intermedius]